MPIYVYRCTKCGHAKDALQRLNDPPLTICPACGEPALQKQVTAAGFQLKGSGWYVTDFRGDSRTRPDHKPDEAGEATKSEAPAGDAPVAQPDTAAPVASPAAKADPAPSE